MRRVSLFLIMMVYAACAYSASWHVQTTQSPLEPFVVNSINTAQQRVWVMQYYLTSAPCVHALARARQRGVDVRVILDRGMQKSPAYHFVTKTLRGAGVPLWWLGPAPLFHHKAAICDNRVLTGSANWTRPGLTSNAEGLVVFEDPLLVQEYVSHYMTLVRRAAGMKEYTQRRSSRIFFIPDHKKELRRELASALEQAHVRVCIAMYAFTATWCWQLLAAAAARGVAVQVLLEPTQVDSAVLHRYAYKNGIELRRYTAPQGILHHKLAIIDDEVWYGSMNWTRAGMRHNQENEARIVDAAVTARVLETFRQLWVVG